MKQQIYTRKIDCDYLYEAFDSVKDANKFLETAEEERKRAELFRGCSLNDIIKILEEDKNSQQCSHISDFDIFLQKSLFYFFSVI